MRIFKRNPQGKVSLLGKQGLFAIAFLCVAVVGMVIAITYDAKDNPEARATQQPTQKTTMRPQATLPLLPTMPRSTDKPVSGDVSETSSLHKPVNANTLLRGHTTETLVFSPTLNQWAVHTGIDIPAAEGTEVFAVLDGTVESAVADPLTGNTVVIAHAGNMKSVYVGLKDINGLEAGQQVLKGSVVGTVGNTNLLEVADGAHLHFEILLNGASVDPMDYLSGLSK